MEIKETRMLDITSPVHVEIEIRNDGKVIWIHVEGVTYFRACRIGKLKLTDHRPDKTLTELKRFGDKLKV